MFTRLPENFSVFESLEDPREQDGNFRHSLFDVVFIALCAMVAGCDTWIDAEQFARRRISWFRKYIRLEYGVPSHDTIGRVMRALDTARFRDCLIRFVEHLSTDLRDRGVHIDGKTLRRSFDSATNKQSLHMVSAWCDDLKLCLGQVATDTRSNEITAVPMLLELLQIEGAVVTMDAMNCQRATVATIIDRKADYVVTVKSNQKALHKAVEAEFLKLQEEGSTRSIAARSHTTTQKTRGRIEERTVTVMTAPRSLKESGRWSKLQTIGMVYRHRHEADDAHLKAPLVESDFVTYFISSLPPNAKNIARHVRSHWTVENQLHWSLDVTFSEDATRIRKDHSAENAACLRRLALSLLKRDTSLSKTSLRLKRKIAGWSTASLDAIIFGQIQTC
jgi:predicted transposase YbfD/YdcC